MATEFDRIYDHLPVAATSSSSGATVALCACGRAFPATSTEDRELNGKPTMYGHVLEIIERELEKKPV